MKVTIATTNMLSCVLEDWKKRVMLLRKCIKKYWEYIVAFGIPLAIVLLHCIIRDSWPFGNGSILKGDAGVQYVDLYKELWNKVHSGDVSFFSWNAAGGFDFYLNMLYYAISPSTIIVLLLPKSCLENALQVFMVLKWALLSVSAAYFFMHTKFNTLRKNRRLVSLTLGLCYSLSGFFLSTMFLFNWTDTLILFPVLLLLVEKMVERGTWKLYFILLTIAIFCNFYIAFPVCIFIFLWFLLQLQTVASVNKKAYITFFGTSIWAAISAMAVILPSVLNVKERYTYGINNENYNLFANHLSLTEIITRFFPFSLEESRDLNVYFYMSIGTIVICLLFCFIKMDKRVKYSKLLIVFVLLLSFLLEKLNLIWHAFSAPHGYNPRYAFALLLMLAVLGMDVLIRIDQIKLWHCICILLVGVGLFCYAFFHIDVYEDFYVYLFVILGLFLYCTLIAFLCLKRIKKESFVTLFCFLCIVELCCNAYYQFLSYVVPKPEEVESVIETTELSDNLPLEAGQRVVFENAGYNGGMQTGLPSMSGFISFMNGKLCNLMGNLGMTFTADAGIMYSGGTPLLDVIFNNAYDIGKCSIERENADIVKEGNELNVYKVKELAGMGYMVSSQVTEWRQTPTLSFLMQNELAMLATGVQEADLFQTFIPEGLQCVTALDTFHIEQMEGEYFTYQYRPVLEKDANIFKFIADKDMDLYFNVISDGRMVLKVSIDDEVVYRYTKGREQYIVPIGKVKKGQNISITCLLENQVGEEILIIGQFAEMNEAIWRMVYRSLTENVYHIIDMESDYICGMIETEKDGIMMTSVPAMRGFSVYLDGEQTDYIAIGGSLMGIPLEAGSHRVEFRYHTPYARMAWLISICSIGMYILFDLIQKRKKCI